MMDLISWNAVLSLPRDTEKTLSGMIINQYVNVRDIEELATADMSCDGCKWEGAYGYGDCSHCMRGYDDMWEAKENETDRR